MSEDHVYKIVQLAGSSSEGLEAAIDNAIAKASETLHHLRWFEVQELRGHVEDGRVAHYQVVLRVGFTVVGD